MSSSADMEGGAPAVGPSGPTAPGVDSPKGIYRILAMGERAAARCGVLRRSVPEPPAGPIRRMSPEDEGLVAALALRRRNDGTGDLASSEFPGSALPILMGATLIQYLCHGLGSASGPTAGRSDGRHWTDLTKGLLAPVPPPGTTLEIMAGVALALRMTGGDRVAMILTAVEAVSTGAWHEGLNLAGVQRCPLVLVVGVGPGHPGGFHGTRLRSLAGLARGYGVRVDSVDGGDLLELYGAARRAVDHARSDGGPVLLEVRRSLPGDGRGAAGDPDRPHGDRPLARLRMRIAAEGWADEEALAGVDAGVGEEVDRAAASALEQPAPAGHGALSDVLPRTPTRPPWTRGEPPDPRAA